MADVLPIRASEEMQARFREFTAAGDFRTQTDFFNHLLTLYAAQETGARIPTLEGAISAVNELTDRINKILIGAGETISANQEKEREQIETLQQEADKKVLSLVTENESLRAGFEEQAHIIEAMRNDLSETQEHEKKLNQMLDDKSALIDGYRDKIDSLETKISRQRVLVTEAEDDRTELENLRIKVKEQELQIEHMTLEKDKALNEQKNIYAEKINVMIAEHETAIQKQKLENGQAKNLNDKALIDLEMKLRKEMNDQQAQYGKTISGYESKVFSLLQEIEKTKNQKEPENVKTPK